MKHLATIAIVLQTAVCSLHSASAAVPLRWIVETSKVIPASFEAYQGETISFDAIMNTYGKPLAEGLDNPRIYWQTNGMGSVYWSAPATAVSNVLKATWHPKMDVGARIYNCFIGVTGSIYRAAFQLRMRPSPGADPEYLPLPTQLIDFSRVTVLNPPWPTNDLTSSVASNAAAIASHSSQLSQLSKSISDIPPPPGNYYAVSNAAMVTLPNEIAGKQDKLPYSTNAVPASVIVGAPWIADNARNGSIDITELGKSGTKALSVTHPLGVGFGRASYGSYGITVDATNKHEHGYLLFPDVSGNQIFATEDYVNAATPGNYAAVSNAAMTAHRDATNYTDAAVAALGAALREYPRIVRRGGMYYTEDIIDRGGDDITYSLSRFAVVTFTARENGTTVTSVINPDYSPTSARPTLEYATTPEWTWHPFVLGETSVTLDAGKRLHLRTPAGVTNGAYYGYSFRVPDGSANLSGDLMALVSCDGLKTVTLQGQFRELWRMCTNLVDASEFSIGATNTTAYAFSKLFDGCVSLTKAPRRLSFNDAKTYALNHFLAHCPITEAPEFDIQKATGERAMWGFFDSCAELVSCDIRSLVDISGNNCIRGLFDYCYSLKRIEVGFTQFQNASYWVEDVPQTSDGVFVCPTALGNNDTITRATTAIKAGCPVNWTVINY